MVWRFSDSGDDGREWSVGDFRLGYRICTYNEPHKQAPTHVHDRFDDVIAGLPDMTKQQATEIVRSYAAVHDWLDVEGLKRVTQEVLHGNPH